MHTAISSADHWELGLFADDTLHLLATIFDDRDLLAREEVMLELIEDDIYYVPSVLRLDAFAAQHLPSSSMREMVENCTLCRIRSRSASGNMFSIVAELFVWYKSASTFTLACDHVMSSHLGLQRVPICQAGLAIDRVGELLLYTVSADLRQDAPSLRTLLSQSNLQFGISTCQKRNHIYVFAYRLMYFS